jgi:phosphatidylserine decarboxylase
MAVELVQFFNRYTQRVETEEVYGDQFLRFTYANPLGRLALHALVKRSIFSRWYGWTGCKAARRSPRLSRIIA